MPLILFSAFPYDKEQVTLALESGVDGLFVPEEQLSEVAAMSRLPVFSPKDLEKICLTSKTDETTAINVMRQGRAVLLERGWEIIPVENLLAELDKLEKLGSKITGRTVDTNEALFGLALEAASQEEAKLAAEILERGADIVVILPKALDELKNIVSELKYKPAGLELETAEIIEIRPVGMGHRVCVDTMSILKRGQGMLAGNSSAFTFLVHAETERSEYVASRPFRINAGGVHSYSILPADRTCYLEEIQPGQELLIVNQHGDCEIATAGRIKIERRPMLLFRAKTVNGAEGSIFLQNAETIRLVTPNGEPVSVVSLKPGDTVLCRTDSAGRHFGMRISEEIIEA